MPTLKVTMTVRQVYVHDSETEYDDHKIENAKARCARSAPSRGAREQPIGGVEQQHENGDDIFGIVIPIPAGEAVHPDKAERGADGDRNQTDENARAAHALEQFERRESP